MKLKELLDYAIENNIDLNSELVQPVLHEPPNEGFDVANRAIWDIYSVEQTENPRSKDNDIMPYDNLAKLMRQLRNDGSHVNNMTTLPKNAPVLVLWGK